MAYTIDQIKETFWEELHRSGNKRFDDEYDTEYYWRDFKEALEQTVTAGEKSYSIAMENGRYTHVVYMMLDAESLETAKRVLGAVNSLSKECGGKAVNLVETYTPGDDG